MLINLNVPFYSNIDNTHCFQATLKMILKYFLPKEEYSWQDLEEISAKKEGLWTWPTAGLIWLQNKGFDIKNIEIFDYSKFIQHKDQYLIDLYGKEVGEAQIANSDIEQEIFLSKQFINKIKTETRIPTINDIKKLLENGYLIICNVNSHILNDKSGYCGHFVVIKGLNENNFVMHDPGPPPLQDRIITFDKFEEAWAYPNKIAKNIMAFKLK